MGMNGFVCATSVDYPFNGYNTLLDSSFHNVLGWQSNIGNTPSYSVINKDRKIWWATDDFTDIHISVFSTNGTMQRQFKIAGKDAVDMVTDTSGHVYLLYTDGSNNGFGIMRFGASFAPDYQKWVSIPGVLGRAEWAIDQRLYQRVGNDVCVLDANGNVIKIHHNQPDNFTVYPDHGIGTVTSVGDTLKVVRRDSAMNLLWARKFSVAPFCGNQGSIARAHVVAMAGSDDLVVIASHQTVTGGTCNPIYPAYLSTAFLVDRNGVLQSYKMIELDSRHVMAHSSPFGDPLVLMQSVECLTSATAFGPTAYVLAGLDMHPNCTGALPLATQIPYSPSSIPSIWTGSSSNLAVALPLDVYSLSFSASGVGVPSYQCEKPCVSVTSQAQGGGVVAFNDDTYGFYSLQYAFGDGTFGSTPNPVHAFPGAGNYNTTIIATNGCGSDTVSISNNPCQSAQIILPGNVCVGNPAVFHEGSGLPNDSLTWLVNGTPTATGDTMIWTTPTAGTYAIGLIFKDGPCRDTTFANYTVFTGPPVPSFTYTLSAYLTLNFTNTSTNCQSYSWTFGDGGTSTATNPSHTYASNGSYTICMTANNGCSSATTCQTWNCAFPTAAFTATPNGATVAIVDQSVGAITRSWAFGDGTTATGLVTNHVYTTSGTYNICQTVTNNCASATICHSVTVVAGGNGSYRINYPALTGVTANAVATNSLGKNLIVGTSTQGAFMMLTDLNGAMLWTKIFPAVNYKFQDVATMPNGNFLVVGGTTVGSQGQMDGLWTEVNGSGSLVTTKILGTAANEVLYNVHKDRNGGYLMGGMETGVIAHVNSALQLLWSPRKSVMTAIGGFQATDNSLWFVMMNPNFPAGRYYMYHFSSLGVPMDSYSFAIGVEWGAVASNKYLADMDCNGNIVIAAGQLTSDNYSQYSQHLQTAQFNPITHQLSGNGTAFYSGLNAAPPYFDVWPQDLIAMPYGEFYVVGHANRLNDDASSPKREKYHQNLANLYGPITKGTANAQEGYQAGCLGQNNATILVGTVDGVMDIEKSIASISYCTLPTSSIHLYANAYGGSMTPNYQASHPYATSPSGISASITPVSSSLGNPGSLVCSTPCSNSVNAAFTYTISGNNVTVTSTSTPGAMLTWNAPGQSCNNSSTFTLPITCTSPVTVSLTASNGCASSTMTQTITLPGPAISLGPDQQVCPGATATFTPGSGLPTYHWSTGSSASSITVSQPGSYSLTVTSTQGCQSVDTVLLSNFPSPAFTLGADTSFCPDTTLQITGPLGGSAYLWSTGATTASITLAAADTVWLQYVDVNGCTASDTIGVTLSSDCVWPGDANHDGIADNLDLLAVGYAMGTPGFPRPNASLAWYGQPAPDWFNVLPSLVNFKHTDCDGNGVVNALDTLLITAHYGFTHNKNTGVTTGIPLFIVPEQDSFPVGDTVFFTVHLGDANTPSINTHGLAFSLFVDPQNVTPGTLYGRYPNSFLGNGVPELITLTYPETGTGRVHIGISRQDRLGRTGEGAVMRVGFLPDVVYPLTNTLGYVPVHLLNAFGVDKEFAPLLLAAMDDSILIYNPLNAQTQPSPLTHWNLFPVPTAGTAIVQLDLAEVAEVEAYLIDLHGRRLRSLMRATTLNLGRHQLSIETDDLSEGMYFVQLVVEGRVMVKKLVVER